jgi:hypothetical protein
LDSIYLPLPIPFLHLLFPLQRERYILILLIVYESMDAVLLSESFNNVIFVLVYPSCQVICHSYVESAISPACHNVDIITVHGSTWIPLVRGMTSVVAEGVGFEPTSPVSQAKRLAGARTRPTMRPLQHLIT